MSAAKHTAIGAACFALLVMLVVPGAPAGGRKHEPIRPPAPTKLRVTSSGPHSFSLAWKMPTKGSSVAGYYVHRNGRSTRQTATTYAAENLACGRSTTVEIVAFSSPKNRSRPAKATVSTAPCPDVDAPTAPTGFVQQATSQTGAVLAWSPSSDNVGVVGYAVYDNLVLASSTAEPVATLSGLSCGSAHQYQVDAYDGSGNHSPPSSVWVQTAPCNDSQPPTAPTGLAVAGRTGDSLSLACAATGTCPSPRSPAPPPQQPRGNTAPPREPTRLEVSSTTPTSVSLTWQAAAEDEETIEYGVYVDGVRNATVSEPGATVSNLTCGSAYAFSVDAHNAAGERSTSASVDGSTAACAAPTPRGDTIAPPTPGSPPDTSSPSNPVSAADTSPPRSPSDLAASQATQTSVSFTWAASTDDIGVAGYVAYVDGARVSAVTQPKVTVQGLKCGTAFTLALDAYDAAGNHSGRAQVTSSTAACADLQAPTAPPSNVIAATRTANSIALTWSASADNLGVTGFGLYQDGSFVESTRGTTSIFAGLSCNTNYTLAVDAYDGVGNRSPQTTVMVSTTACPDTTPPSPATALVASNVARTSLDLSWNASNGAAEYDVYRDTTKVGTVTSTSFSETGLECGTSYTFGVVAKDTAGKTSAPAPVTVSTSHCTSPVSNSGTLFGVHQDLLYFGGESYWADRIDVATTLGARVSRSSFLWDRVEPTRGVFDWSVPDGVVDALVSRGIAPLMVLVGSPSWANGSTDRFVVPQDPAAYSKWVANFANFARAAAARYKDRVHYWEIWNEENEKYFWKPAPRSAQRYIQLYNAVRAAMLAADPSAKIAVGGLAGVWYSCCISGKDFLAQMVAAGSKIDYVAIHPYDGGAPDVDTPYDSNFTDIGRIHDYLTELGLPSVGLWVTEWGWKDRPEYLQKSLEMLENYPYVDLATYFLDISTPDYPGYGLFDGSLHATRSGQVLKDFLADHHG